MENSKSYEQDIYTLTKGENLVFDMIKCSNGIRSSEIAKKMNLSTRRIRDIISALRLKRPEVVRKSINLNDPNAMYYVRSENQ